MLKEKRALRLIPGSIYDIPALETWLADLAEQGLFLCDFILMFGRFSAGAPRKVRYRLELTGQDEDYPSAECRELYEKAGWRYVLTFRRLYHIFISDNADAPEVHTDPVVQSYTIERLSRRLLTSAVVAAVQIVAVISYITYSIAIGGILGDIALGARVSDLFIVFIWLFLISREIAFAVEISRLKKQLHTGLTLDHYKSYARKKAYRIAELLLLVALFAAIICSWSLDANNGWSKDRPMPEAGENIPLVTLSTLEFDKNFSEETAAGHYSFKHTILAPRQYKVVQPRLTMYYYETAFKGLGKPVYEKMTGIYCGLLNQNKPCTVLNTDLFDGASYSAGDDDQRLVCWKGNKVIVIWYYGKADLTEKLDDIAQAMDE